MIPKFKVGEEALFLTEDTGPGLETLQGQIVTVEAIDPQYTGLAERLVNAEMKRYNPNEIIYSIRANSSGTQADCVESYLHKLPPPEDRMDSWPDEKEKPIKTLKEVS